MATTLLVDVNDFANFEGQEIGRELEFEVTAIVTQITTEIPGYVMLDIVRADISQTT